MRLPSIDQAVRGARNTLGRFPFVLLVALVATITGVPLVDSSQNDELLRGTLSALLGLPLLFAVRTAGERNDWPVARRRVIELLAITALFLYFLISAPWTDTHLATRTIQLALAFHLLVAVLPFLGAGSLHGFWQFNRILFLRFLLATLYAAVLFLGLSLALLALDNLFGIDIPDEMYGRLWIVMAFLFHPWFLLAGVPRGIDALDRLEEYPNGLKVFSQFVLVPLTTVYLSILTAYLVRVIVTSTWPSGWIGWLVSGVAAVGTLALLLVHPVREREDARWVNLYGRWFFVALLPSIVMLLMATGQRIEQYGFTERRYFLLLLALWLAGIALYYGITGSRNIRVIPATLCLLALATLAGPWSAHSVSRSSQIGRFETYLERNSMREGGAIVAPAREISFEDRREMSEIVRYLTNTHGAGSLARIDPSLADTTGLRARIGVVASVDERAAYHVLERIGVAYVPRRQATTIRSFYISARQGYASLDVSGYDRMFHVNLAARTDLPLDGDTLVLEITRAGDLALTWQGEQIDAGSIRALVERIQEEGRRSVAPTDTAAPAPRPPGQTRIDGLTIDARIRDLRIRIVFLELNGQFDDPGLQVFSAQSVVLIDRP